jgi:hypothetical protein
MGWTGRGRRVLRGRPSEQWSPMRGFWGTGRAGWRYAVSERCLAAKIELGQLPRCSPCYSCDPVVPRYGTGCTMQPGGATTNEAETTVVRKSGFHGATLTDIRANVSPWGVCFLLLPNWLRCCAGNWRYTRQAYWARALAQASPLSCEQAAL